MRVSASVLMIVTVRYDKPHQYNQPSFSEYFLRAERRGLALAHRHLQGENGAYRK